MNLSSIIIFIVYPAILIVFFIYLRWYIKNRTSPSGVLQETRAEIKRWIQEANETIIDINGVTDKSLTLIEDKIDKLNDLLEDADKRISLYVKELEKSKAGENLYTQLGRGVRAAIHNAPDVINISQASSPELSNARPDIPVYSANTMLVKKPALRDPSSYSSSETSSAQRKPSKKEIRAQIDQLASEGVAPEQIAEQLGISIGEVDIAMRLRGRRSAPN